MTNEDKVIHHDAINELRQKMGGWFGDADGLFALHKLDEDRAKEARKLAVASFVTIDEIAELTLGYYRRKGFKNQEHINQQLDRVIKFFSK